MTLQIPETNIQLRELASCSAVKASCCNYDNDYYGDQKCLSTHDDKSGWLANVDLNSLFLNLR